MSLVVMQISAGLGNQLFQYACGRSMAKRLAATLKLDTDSFSEQSSERHFGLRNFGVKTPELGCADRLRLRISCGRTLGGVGRWLKPLFETLLLDVADDVQNGFQPEILNHSGSLYLRGFWQSEKYFQNVADEVRAEFNGKILLNGESSDLYHKLAATNAVCVHVRRGDLVANPIYRSQYYLQDRNYYEQALSKISAKVPSAEYFVFSDDPRWPQDNLKFPGPVAFFNGPSCRSDWEDMLIMSSCQNFVIANSTFSWWAAWLSNAVGKMVVAPKQWRTKDSGPPPDLIPPGWVVL